MRLSLQRVKEQCSVISNQSSTAEIGPTSLVRRENLGAPGPGVEISILRPGIPPNPIDLFCLIHCRSAIPVFDQAGPSAELPTAHREL